MNNLTPSLKATSPLAQWLSYLEQSHNKVIDLGLERVGRVAAELNLLKPAPLVITVGGTNGKGTTCRLLEVILLKAGLRVGVYSSPHLLRYNERVRIQGEELPDSAHTASFAFIEEGKTESLSYFEFSTLSALHLFREAKLDVVILEVGLGGRLDATNIVDNDIAVITGIDIDHTDFLGDTREQIAFEKAGIFRANRVAVIGEPDVPQTMLDYAQSLPCKVFRRGEDWRFQERNQSWHWECDGLSLSDLPLPQIPLANAATALAVVAKLPFEISQETLRQALAEVQLTGRFQGLNAALRQQLASSQNLSLDALPEVIIDVGHNPQAASFLAGKLHSLNHQGRIIAVCGMLKDKDSAEVFKRLKAEIDEWICVTLTGPRGQTGAELAAKLHPVTNAQSLAIADSVELGVTKALRQSNPQDIVLVFGSFHTVGEFLEMLN